MKMKLLSGIALLAAMAFIVSCDDDDDYDIYTTDIITVIESTDISVTSTTATVTSTVLDLSDASSTSYSVGVCYATTRDSSSATKVTGTLEDGILTTEITGLATGVTYYYWTYCTLQSKVTKYSTAKVFVTTDADIATASNAVASATTATLSGTVTLDIAESDEVTKGIYISLNATGVDEGMLIESDDESNSFSVSVSGLVPSLTYYYVAYLSLNGTEYYGDVESFTADELEMEFVDLGLSVNWGTMNIGATATSETGGGYGYGDNTLFNTSTSVYDYVYEDIRGTDYDIASMYITEGYTPSQSEWEELISNTTQEYTTVNGVGGYTFTASNGASIFIPVANYWSSTADVSDSEHGVAVAVTSDGVNVSSASLWEDLAIRPVQTLSRSIDVSLLCKTWALDLDADGNSVYWDGPLYYYGTDDSWNTVTNGWTIDGDTWNWCPVYSENTWIATAMNHGTMTFNEDGSVEVNDLSNSATYSGTWEVDEDNYTITLTDAEILHLGNFDELVTNWSTELKVMSLNEKGLQIAALRDNSDEGECLLVFNYVDYDLVGGNGSTLVVDNDKIIIGDLEGNGNLRVEIYNEYGSGTAQDSPISQDFSFSSNLAVTWTLSGVTLNSDAVGQYDAVMSYADASWDPSYWGGTPKCDALVTGDGTYTNFVEVSYEAEGAVVWVIDISGMANDIADMSAVSVTIDEVVLDQNTENLYYTIDCDNSKVLFNNKDGNEQDGRIELYNLYGDSAADPAVNPDDISFEGRMTVTFTISGIDGNTYGNYSSYSAALSYSDPDWWPYWWGGSVGGATVTGDGTYTVYGDTRTSGDGLCEGAVVFTIELYDLWVDLIDTSAISVTIDEITAETAD